MGCLRTALFDLFAVIGLAGGLATAEAVLAADCDPGVPISKGQREELFTQLRISKAGTQLLEQFGKQYGTLQNLFLQWDTVSYSQVSDTGVCVFLSRRLAPIENVADLAHELVHATRLPAAVLQGAVPSAEEFVRTRLAGQGGEAEAFAVECEVKREILGGKWDALCAPYATGNDAEDVMDQGRVVRDLYNGELSASLTGEPYPVLLSQQFMTISRRRRSIASKLDRYRRPASSALRSRAAGAAKSPLEKKDRFQ